MTGMTRARQKLDKRPGKTRYRNGYGTGNPNVRAHPSFYIIQIMRLKDESIDALFKG